MEQKDGEKQQNSSDTFSEAEGLEITFYTDPLCCWTWAMQPQWENFLNEFSSSTTVRYKMAGLIPSWNNFNDSLNSIRKPIQMGPEWMHAQSVSGVEINDRIWITDPPASSFPACIAVKCAELQSPNAAHRFFNMLQKAVMTDNLNIARTAALLDLALQYAQQDETFDFSTFRLALLGNAGKEAFRRDWQEAKYRGILRLPSLIFRSAGHGSNLLTGFQSLASLQNAAAAMRK